ncbi:putative ribonuclease H-like domain-containing protein [Tanacetum coccineum]
MRLEIVVTLNTGVYRGSNTEDLLLQAGAAKASSTNTVITASTPVSTASPYGGLSFTDLTNTDQDDSEIPALEDIYNNPTAGIFTNASYDDEGAVADFTNLETIVNVYRNKKDERGVVVRNKARLVAQRHRQEEGIDYDEVFAPVARIEAVRIFLAFTFYMGFIVYQMDVKSAFLYGKIDKEVYVSQPPGFVDPKYPKKFYKSRYRRGTIDKNLFIKKDKNDIILVQVNVDDIIFGSTKRSLSQEVLVDILERITEHGLSSEITQSPSGSSNTSEGSKTSGSFKDYGRSDED